MPRGTAFFLAIGEKSGLELGWLWLGLGWRLAAEEGGVIEKIKTAWGA